MEVRTRQGVLIGHAANHFDGVVKYVKRLPLPLGPDSRFTPLGEQQIVRTDVAHFEVHKGVCTVDDQDPYLLPGFIPLGKSFSLEVSVQVTADFKAAEGESYLRGHITRQLVEALLDDKLVFHTVKRDSAEMLTNHRFSIYITRGAPPLLERSRRPDGTLNDSHLEVPE